MNKIDSRPAAVTPPFEKGWTGGIYPTSRITIPTRWFGFLCIGCILLTIAETALVNRKHGLFTGGFLAAPVAGIWESSAIFSAVWLSNWLATVILFLPVSALLIRAGGVKPTVLALSAFSAFAPIVLTDLMNYQLIRFFGDQINYHLLSHIAGGSFQTMLSHLGGNHWLLLALGLTGLFTALALAAGAWLKFVPASRKLLRPWTGLICLGGFFAGTLLVVGSVSLSSEKLDNGLRRFPAARVIQLSLHYLSDVDRDGFSVFSHPPDCKEMDPVRHPYAPDLPGNGIDENGLMGDLPARSIPHNQVQEKPQYSHRPIFVVLVLESFRNDLLFSSVQEREVTPHLNRLAQRGAHTQWGVSHNGYTIGALNAIFGGTVSGHVETTLVDDFKNNGYYTAGFSGANESFGDVDDTTGLNRMDYFYDARQDKNRRCSPFTAEGSLTVPAEVVIERLEKFLTEYNTQKPLFLYVNFQDLHFPYHHYAVKPYLNSKPLPRTGINPENLALLKETYLNTAAYLDENVGKLFSLLKSRFREDAALVITADHGESLFDDHFLGHGHHLNDIQTRVPVIAYGFPAKIKEPMGHIEIRRMINEGLMMEDTRKPPVKTIHPEKRIFQYLGNIRRPQQIAWASLQDRLIVDIRNYRWKKENAIEQWRSLAGRNFSDDLMALVHAWETLQLQEFELVRSSSAVVQQEDLCESGDVRDPL